MMKGTTIPSCPPFSASRALWTSAIKYLTNSLAISASLISLSVAATPYGGEVSMFEDGVQVTKSYHQMLEEQPVEELSPLSRTVHEPALNVFRNPESAAYKEKYLASFPQNFSEFSRVFDPPTFDQLYDGFIYIHLLNELGDEYPEVVGEIYLRLASEACLAADAPGHLRHHMMDFRKRHSQTYRKYKDRLTPQQQENVELFESASFPDPGKGLCAD